MLSIVLESEGFATVVCYDGLRAVERFPTIGPDLILLDVMLPGLDGVEVAKEIRNTSQVPIIMLTAKSDTRDVVSGLAAGADDYVAKPFKVAELVARIKARLRVAAPILQARAEDRGNVQVINEGGVTINRAEHTATKNGSDLNLTPMEFELLFVLAANSGEVLSRGELLEKVWGYQNSGDARLVNVHVQRLRQKVEDNPEHPQIIQTVRGVGYKFVPPANDAD
ncbi:response regulator transcription factor [Bifidobacterium sp. 82T24]|uniref:MtrAB system response regulator MtrA n=1 Tax=Bifidobacterium pluvialisilvae TaxID=2834436 RepID=UPI001C59F9AD|nr:response regulator transcription factor [Bifidobacterium pluvialisilvae]